MGLRSVEMMPGKFLYRCDDCGFEHPKSPVKKHELGPPPAHNCPRAGHIPPDPSFFEKKDK